MTMSLQEISDRLEIQDLLVAYSHAIDTRNWDALDDVFTPDAFIDYSDFGGGSGDVRPRRSSSPWRCRTSRRSSTWWRRARSR